MATAVRDKTVVSAAGVNLAAASGRTTRPGTAAVAVSPSQRDTPLLESPKKPRSAEGIARAMSTHVIAGGASCMADSAGGTTVPDSDARGESTPSVVSADGPA